MKNEKGVRGFLIDDFRVLIKKGITTKRYFPKANGKYIFNGMVT